MNPSTRTRHLNQWIQTHSGQDMTYPALHGFLCARLVGPDAPDWQAPLAGLLPHDAELDEKSAEALHHLIAELEAQADEAQLALPSQCRLSTDSPEQVFEQSHPLGQWCYGFSQGFASWPKPKDLNDPTTQYRFSLAAELSLFRDKPMAQMLHAAAGSELPFMEFCKRQRQNMKTALNQLLQLDEYQAVPDAQAALDSKQAEQWQQWFELADACRDPQARLGWFDKVIDDAEPLFDAAFWQQMAGHGWSAHEARPLLAARAGRADCLLRLGDRPQAIGIEPEPRLRVKLVSSIYPRQVGTKRCGTGIGNQAGNFNFERGKISERLQGLLNLLRQNCRKGGINRDARAKLSKLVGGKTRVVSPLNCTLQPDRCFIRAVFDEG